jgi:cytochrome c oxidase assembly protein subunit 15
MASLPSPARRDLRQLITPIVDFEFRAKRPVRRLKPPVRDSMTTAPNNPWLHRLAVLTATLALLPIVMGAIVTTKDAGMAFPDWPTSDGHGMFAYPWLQSAGHKFLEHGHRLAGIAIGIASIALCVTFAVAERRIWVKALALLALLSVILQGWLGGQRVLMDARGLAFIHGSFAALVFSLLCGIAVATSGRWRDPGSPPHTARLSRLRTLACVACGFLFTQYLLGGLLRHQGKALHEHLGFAFVAAAVVIWLAMSAAATGIAWLRAPAALLALGILLQLALGAGAWVTKFGFGDYVAVYGSPLQVAVRTGHVLTGMLLFATCVVLAIRIARVHWLQSSPANASGRSASISALALPGGAR